MCSNRTEYVKILLNTLSSLSFAKTVFLETSKMMSPNSDNSVIIHTEKGLDVIFKGNAVLGREWFYS